MLFIFCCVIVSDLPAQSVVQGTVLDEEGRPVGGIIIMVLKNGVLINEINTNTEGYYRLSLDPGTYEFHSPCSINYCISEVIDNIILLEGKERRIDLLAKNRDGKFCSFEYLSLSDPTQFESNQNTSATSILSKDLELSPSRKIYQRLAT
ncbi:MAG: carboxypeptidase-like regulatory domain-containing protein, partial [Bacteroidota bacterium]